MIGQTSRSFAAACTATLIGALPACSAPLEPGRYDLGGDIHVLERRVYWLDADTVAFAGRAGSDSEGPYSLYLWDVGEAPRAYRPALWENETAVWRSQFCASDGSLYLSANPPQLTDVPGRFAYDGEVGPPGREVRTTFHSFRASAVVPGAEREAPGVTPRNANPFAPLFGQSGIDCVERYDAAMSGQEWAETYPGLGYIVFDKHPRTERYSNARLRLPEGGERRLPIAENVAEPICVNRTPWNGRVWAWSCRVSSSPQADEPGFHHSVWDIDPRTGETEETVLPNSPITRTLDAVPTQRGLFFASDSGWEHEGGGFHRLVDGKLQKVMSGDFSLAVVSPDGCKVVAMHYQHPIQGPEKSLTVYDACGNHPAT